MTEKMTPQAGGYTPAHPYTLDEIEAKIASGNYSAELLLQHAMLLLTAAAIPPGYVLVPAAPTPSMVKAAADAWLDCGSRLCLNKAAAAVRAGIAAAQQGATNG